MSGTITLWDLYLQLKNFQLKKPTDFMLLVLKDFPINSFGRFGSAGYYMASFTGIILFIFVFLYYQPPYRYLLTKYLGHRVNGRLK